MRDAGVRDGGARDACTPVAELCGNGIDDDCDGTADEGCECTPGATQLCDCGGMQTCGADARWGACTGGEPPRPYYRDGDRDGLGDPAMRMDACEPPGPDWVPEGTDCDDTNPAVGAGQTYYPDMDGDGWGTSEGSTTGCTPPGDGWQATDGDCDDDCAHCRPSIDADICDDGRDNDCDGRNDEDPCSCRYFVAAGRAYVFCSTNESWPTGQARCESYGGYLASFETPEENTAVWAALPDRRNDVWVGGTDEGSENMWRWISDGSTICTRTSGCASCVTCASCPTCNWASGEPDDHSNRNCMLLRRGTGEWDARACNNGHRVLCELGPAGGS